MTASPESLRLALVITAMGCGGAEGVMAQLANFLVRRGHRVQLLVLHGGEVFYPLAGAVEVALCPARGGTALSRSWQRLAWLRRRLAHLAPQVVVSFIEVANVYALLAAPGQTPVIVSERTDPRRHRSPATYEVLRRVLYRRAERLVVQGEELRGWATARVPPPRVVVLPNPVFPAPPAAPLPRAPQLVGVGRLSAEKGFDLFIQVFARLAPRFPPWQLVIYGEGPQRPGLERLAQQLHVGERVQLPGALPNPANFLAAQDIFVLPSRYEGFPNALAEAMARGVAVVAFDCPSGPRQLIRHGRDGVLVPAGDTQALEQALAHLMAEAEERRRLGEAAREVSQRFPAEEILASWEGLCRKVARPGEAR